MSWIGEASILVAVTFFCWPFARRQGIDLKAGPPLAWLWAMAFLVSGLIVLFGPAL